jgi:Flp pilus assembly protein TadG
MRRGVLRKRLLTRVREERGAELIEFGLVSILFFMLLFGIMEFGRAIWIYDTVAHAAKEGTRYAIVRGSESGRAASAADVEDYVRSRATGMTVLAVTTTWEPDNDPGSVVEVRVQSPFEPVVWFLPPIPLTSTSRMVIAF